MSDSGLIRERHKMELKSVVFNAAKDGKLYRLKVFLDHRPKEEVAMLVSARTNGATPLIAACKNGDLDVVLYLIEECHAGVEQLGSETFEGETVEGVSPLWCAAAAGHLNVVEWLISYKASVNHTSKTNSTPLRAACFGGHVEVVKYLIKHGADIEIANRHGHTCLMIACRRGHYKISEYLVKCGADVNRKSLTGNTALHECAESDNLDILTMLLQNGAVFCTNSIGMTPLLSAAVAGQTAVVEYIIYYCTKLEKINALELLGATFVDKKQDMVLAHDCWRRAMRFRYEDARCLIVKPKSRSPIASYVDADEAQNFFRLEELLSDPEEMRKQALLVRERILGPGHPETIYYITYWGTKYADQGDYDRCIRLWMYALDVQQKIEEPLSPVIQNSLIDFAELFSDMMAEVGPFARGHLAVSFRDIFCIFERTLKEIERALEVSQKQHLNDNSQFHQTLIIAMHLVGLMCRLQPHMNKSEELEFKKAVHKLVHLNPRARNGRTPLHLACLKDSSTLGEHPVFTFPSLEVVDILLEVGACPHALDLSHDTPLHIVAMNKPCARAIFNSLLNHGAHLDLCNHKKQTPLQLAQHTPLLDDVYPLRYINLQCLSARAVQTHKIPYKGLVHKRLEVFLDAH